MYFFFYTQSAVCVTVVDADESSVTIDLKWTKAGSDSCCHFSWTVFEDVISLSVNVAMAPRCILSRGELQHFSAKTRLVPFLWYYSPACDMVNSTGCQGVDLKSMQHYRYAVKGTVILRVQFSWMRTCKISCSTFPCCRCSVKFCTYPAIHWNISCDA